MTSLFQQFLEDASGERARVQTAANLLSRDETILESTELGITRWYLHRHLDRPSTTSLYFHELELPPRAHGPRIRCQGGIVHFVVAGSGYAVVDGRRHDWEALDVIGIPPKEFGVTYQLFNDSEDEARVLVVWPNLDSALGPDGGVEFEVMEPASTYTGDQ